MSPTPQNTHPNTPLLLVIIDGFGLRDGGAADDAVARAAMPCWKKLVANHPMARLQASEESVGLPHGQMGNSEVGHMNIGSGRVILQELPRISRALADGEFAHNPVWQETIATLRHSGGALHLIGVLSLGGVHGYQDHMAQVVGLAAAADIPLWLHFITDGRDTPPKTALQFWDNFQTATKGLLTRATIRPATVSGRYFAMDRDKNWQRTERAFRAMALGLAQTHAPDVATAITQAYEKNTSDEFIDPTVIGHYDGMKTGDSALFMNFRADRARQLSTALVADDFAPFARDQENKQFAKPTPMVGLVEYEKTLSQKMKLLFGKEEFADTFGAVVAGRGLRQLRIAETEKYAHVTFFFNGGREQPYEGEDRILIPSPKVATYDLKPEMSAPAVTEAVLDSLKNHKHDVIILNYANADMVGHSGKMPPAIKALETVDDCLAQLLAAVTAAGGTMIITADHGNIETMFDPASNQPNTAHTLNPVPFMVLGNDQWLANYQLAGVGKLADIAPTMLTILNIPQPAAMTGQSLLVRR